MSDLGEPFRPKQPRKPHPDKSPGKRKRRPREVQLRIDSLTRVNPIRSHGLGLWRNRRVVFGVRVDEGLKKAFNSVSKRVFGSTCIAIESFMAGVVGLYQNPTLDGVNPSITIGEIRIERNLRDRRKGEVERHVSETTSFLKMDQNLVRLKGAGKQNASMFKQRVDYSQLGLEELKKRYETASLGAKQVIAFELKRRAERLQ